MIYIDNAATTPLKPEVLEEMMPYYLNKYGNSGSPHQLGREAKNAVEYARGQVSTSICAKEHEIYFTSSGTEANNWLLKGAAQFKKENNGKNHIITSSIEHSSVLKVCKYLEQIGFFVTYLPVTPDGFIDPKKVEESITDTTALISIMFANNEIGTIQPIEEIGQIAHSRNILFHTDAVQAIGNIDIDINRLNIDALSMSAHKFHGPKGIGALYLKKTSKITPLLHGGHQERGMRASTENVPAIIGMGKAIELALSQIEKNNERLTGLRDKVLKGIIQKIPYTHLNGDINKRLSGHLNIAFDYIEGEALLMMLDNREICASAGSACTAGAEGMSHVLKAIGLDERKARSSLRITLSSLNTEDEIDAFLTILTESVLQLREMNPYYGYKQG